MSGYEGSHDIDDVLYFTCRAHTPATSADVDADSLPTFDVREDGTDTALLPAQNTAKFDDANSLGYYVGSITLSAANGFEDYKEYHIDIHTIVGGVTSSETRKFQIKAKVDAVAISAPTSSAADIASAVATELAMVNTTILSYSSQTSFTLTAASAQDDAYNGQMIMITDAASGIQRATGLVSDYTGSSKTVTLSEDPLSGFTFANGDTVLIMPVPKQLPDTALNDPTVAAIADGVWDEALSGHAATGSAGRFATLAGGILIDTTATGAPTSTTVQLTAGSAIDDFYNDQLVYVLSGTGIGQVRPVQDYTGSSKTITVDEPWITTPAASDQIVVIATHVHPLTQLKSETVDALNADTYAEPGQEAPAATASLVTKIGYLYKGFRNRSTQTSSEYDLYADDAATVDQKATFSDDTVTADRGELESGP